MSAAPKTPLWLLITRRMEEHGLRVPDLANLVDVDERTVSRWRNGGIPQPRHRTKLAEHLGGEPSDYADGDGEDPKVRRLERANRRLRERLAAVEAELRRQSDGREEPR